MKDMDCWHGIRTLCPKLYRNGMHFECDEGWQDIIMRLSMEIERILDKNPESNEMFAVQVKEKYGMLRFYMSMEEKEIHELIEETEALSSQICEKCGAFAKMRGGYRIKTLCSKCFGEKNDKRNSEEKS